MSYQLIMQSKVIDLDCFGYKLLFLYTVKKQPRKKLISGVIIEQLIKY
jgi:hypothetical protein